MNTPPVSNNRRSRRSVSARPLSALKGLTDAQLCQLDTWLDEGISYENISSLCRESFHRDVPIATIRRYYHRGRTREFLDDSLDSQKAASEISQYAATGEAHLSAATIYLLESQAFHLALNLRSRGDTDDHLDKLKSLFLLIHKAKNTSIRERHAVVQERKCDLREVEFQFKKEQAVKREQRCQHKFEQLEIPPFEISPSGGVLSGGNRPENTSSASNATDFWEGTGAQPDFSGESWTDPGTTLESDGTEPSRKPWQVPPHLVAGTVDPESVSDPDLATPAAFPPALIAAVKSYTARRIAEYRVYLAWGAKGFYHTKLIECPCGESHPCSVHGGFLPIFWNTHPWSDCFRDPLLEKGLPYCPPAHRAP